MVSIYVRHSVKDYDAWRTVFDQHGDMRKAAGGRGGVVYRDASDPNRITTIMEWDSEENAERFSGSDDLREAMKLAGVIGQPEVRFLKKTSSSAT